MQARAGACRHVQARQPRAGAGKQKYDAINLKREKVRQRTTDDKRKTKKRERAKLALKNKKFSPEIYPGDFYPVTHVHPAYTSGFFAGEFEFFRHSFHEYTVNS